MFQIRSSIKSVESVNQPACGNMLDVASVEIFNITATRNHAQEYNSAFLLLMPLQNDAVVTS